MTLAKLITAISLILFCQDGFASSLEKRKSSSEIPKKSPPPKASLADAPEKSSKKSKYLKVLKEKWLIPQPRAEYERLSRRFKGFTLFDTEDRPWVVPGVTLLSPTGYSAKWGDIFFGFNMVNRTPLGDRNKKDAFAVIGFGLGDPMEWLGFEISVGFVNVRKLLGSGKGLTVKVSHTFPDGTSLAIGKINFLEFPKGASTYGSSEYFSISRAFVLNYNPRKPLSLLVATLGIGDGQFKSFLKALNQTPGMGVYGALGLRVVEPLTVIANWQQNLHLGASVAPFQNFPIIFNLAAVDTLKGDGDGVRYAVGFSYTNSIFSKSFPVDWFNNDKL